MLFAKGTLDGGRLTGGLLDEHAIYSAVHGTNVERG
jgi:hypothetical protein